MTHATAIKLPARCAWCGIDTRLSLQSVKFEQPREYDSYLRLCGNWFRFRTVKMSLPICEECKVTFQRNQKRMTYASALGGFFAGGAILLFFLTRVSLSYLSFAMVFVVSLSVGTIFDFIIATILSPQRSWGTVDYGKIKFRNRQFQDEFYRLNPHLR